MPKVKAKLHVSKILHPAQSYMVVLFYPIRKDTYLCYFAPYAKCRNNDNLRLIKKKFYSANKLTPAKLHGCAIFRASRKVPGLCFFAHWAKLQECAFSRIGQSYGKMLFGALLEKRLSVPYLCKSKHFCNFLRSENYIFCLISHTHEVTYLRHARNDVILQPYIYDTRWWEPGKNWRRYGS